MSFLNDGFDIGKVNIEDTKPALDGGFNLSGLGDDFGLGRVMEKFDPVTKQFCHAAFGALCIASPEAAMVTVVIAEAAALIFTAVEVICGEDIGMTPEEMGKCMELIGNGPAQIEDNSGYLKSLESKLDEARTELETATPEERAGYAMQGTQAAMAIAENQTGMQIDPGNIAAAKNAGMTGEELGNTISEYSKTGADSMGSLSDFAGGKLDKSEQALMRESLEKGISEANPGMSEDEVNDRIYDIKEDIFKGPYTIE